MRSFRLRSACLVFAAALLACAAAVLLLLRAEPAPAAKPPESAKNSTARLEQVGALLAWSDRSIEQLREKKLDELKKNLKSSVDIAHGVVEYFQEAARRRVFSEAQAKRQAMEALRTIRYDGDRYFWADTTDYQVLVLPFKPSEEGRNWENVTDAEGRKFAKELADRAAAEGEVYLNYRLRRGGEDQPVLKQGYARLFKAWNWVIGSSKFTDLIDREIAEAERAALVELRKLIYGSAAEPDGLYVVDQAGRFILNADAALIGKAADQSAAAETLRYDKRGWTVLLPRRAAASIAAGRAATPPAGPVLPAALAALAVGLAAAAAAFAAASGLAGQLGRLEKAMAGLSADPAAWVPPPGLPRELDGLVAGLRRLPGAPRLPERPQPIEDRRPAQELAAEIRDSAAGLSELAALIERRDSAAEPSARIKGALLELNRSAAAEAEAARLLVDDAGGLPAQFEGIRATVSSAGALIASMRETVESAREESSDSREVSRSIKSGIDDMMEMIDVINDIAERINVLAINAAIEAAHAGDAGKGFMVIGEEIRRLADGTRQNSETISQSLTNLIGQLEAAAENADTEGGGLQRLGVQLDEAEAARRRELELLDASSQQGAGLARDLTVRVSRLAVLSEGAGKALAALESEAADKKQTSPAGHDSIAAGFARLAEKLKSVADKLQTGSWPSAGL